jgi:molecular chaperone HtpG
MRVPNFLDALIREDMRLSAGIGTALAAMDPIIRSSRLPFFPEYTDHGPQHNEEVLQAAVDLIHDDGRSLLTPQDAAILVLAVLLHDCGMHLTEDGFVSLIQPGCRWTGVPAFADRPWAELWEEFIADARKFDDRKLTVLFGDPEPIRRPPTDPAQLTERDKLLIGEFLRRQHPRLAHDIALRGIPAADGGSYAVLIGVSDDLTDMAGVVARSHGVPLRNCLDYLRSRYHSREFQGAHAVFLMVLLRIC